MSEVGTGGFRVEKLGGKHAMTEILWENMQEHMHRNLGDSGIPGFLENQKQTYPPSNHGSLKS